MEISLSLIVKPLMKLWNKLCYKNANLVVEVSELKYQDSTSELLFWINIRNDTDVDLYIKDLKIITISEDNIENTKEIYTENKVYGFNVNKRRVEVVPIFSFTMPNDSKVKEWYFEYTTHMNIAIRLKLFVDKEGIPSFD